MYTITGLCLFFEEPNKPSSVEPVSEAGLSPQFVTHNYTEHICECPPPGIYLACILGDNLGCVCINMYIFQNPVHVTDGSGNKTSTIG